MMKQILLCLTVGLISQLFFSQEPESLHYGILRADNYTTGMQITGNNSQSIDYHLLEMLNGNTYRLFGVAKNEMPAQFYLGYFEFQSKKVGKIVAVDGDIQDGAIFSTKKIEEIELKYLLGLLVKEKVGKDD